MANKYEISKDENGNAIYNWKRVAEDMVYVVWGKRKLSKALYEVMVMRFTIAHYNLDGWLHTYNKHWGDLAKEIEHRIGWLNCTLGEKEVTLPCLVAFLKEHDSWEAKF